MISEEIQKKRDRLHAYLRELGSAAVAYSSGVDSTYLLKEAADVLPGRVIAVTVSPPWFAGHELRDSIEYCRKLGIEHIVCDVDGDSIEGFRENPKDKCYICKKALFTRIMEAAHEHGTEYVMDGSNADDVGDYRPGMRALAELGIRSPLKDCGFTKQDIRICSRELELPTWDKPAFACLASRFPYGERITDEKLAMVDKAEALLMELGFKQFRCRIHGNMARIEVMPEDFPRIMEESVRTVIMERYKEYGFTYVSLDLQGFRSGSMNETLTAAERIKGVERKTISDQHEAAGSHGMIGDFPSRKEGEIYA
jgi:pyridinium-3,5-biscarboxylic acid mononucleotide sulfurtransferase